MRDNVEHCDTELTLGIGLDISMPKSNRQDHKRKDPLNLSVGLEASDSMITNGDLSSDNEIDDDGENNENENDNNARPRKKLCLSPEQVNVLEEEFKEHNTLTNAQKRELAALLDLTPRQVEVWFQNRRARTKLKQTEVERDEWKMKCEYIMARNRELRRLLEDIRSFNRGESLRRI